MASNLRLTGDLDVTGRGNFGSLTVPNGSITNQSFSANPADRLTYAKMEHVYKALLAQPVVGAGISQNSTLNMAVDAGTVLDVKAGVVSNFTGTANLTIDLKKNGVSILSGPFVLNSTNPAFTYSTALLSCSTFAAGDLFTATVVANSGNGSVGNGPWLQVIFRESGPGSI
jgi:hypothetical protein